MKDNERIRRLVVSLRAGFEGEGSSEAYGSVVKINRALEECNRQCQKDETATTIGTVLMPAETLPGM